MGGAKAASTDTFEALGGARAVRSRTAALTDGVRTAEDPAAALRGAGTGAVIRRRGPPAFRPRGAGPLDGAAALALAALPAVGGTRAPIEEG